MNSIADTPADRAGLVTVVIPVYNRLTFLEQSIRSALQQSYPHREVIVIDDGSDVDVEPVLRPFGSAVALHRKRNGGPASARNLGIGLAKGAFLLFLDDDDFLEPHALQVLVNAIGREPGAGWARGRFAYVNEQGERLAKVHGYPFHSGDVYAEMIAANLVGAPSTVLARADAVRSLGGFDEDRAVQLCEDYDLWLSMARRYPVAAVADVVANYRLSAVQGSRNWRRHYEAWLTVLSKHQALARPGSAGQFDLARAHIHRVFGDHCYLAGSNTEARRHWALAYARGALRRRPWLWRNLKSHLPQALVQALRRARGRARQPFA